MLFLDKYNRKNENASFFWKDSYKLAALEKDVVSLYVNYMWNNENVSYFWNASYSLISLEKDVISLLSTST
jgi:hypothetical protein